MNPEAANPETVGGVRVRPVPHCAACGAPGRRLYKDLTDRLGDVPGRWSVCACSRTGCGLLWLDPMPLAADVALLYPPGYNCRNDAADVPTPDEAGWLHRAYEKAKHGYVAQRYGYRAEGRLARLLGLLVYLHPTKRTEVDGRVMYLPALEDGRALDVGFGSGWTLEALHALGWRVEGVEVDPESVDRARSRGFDVRQGTLEAQQYPDASFDAVLVSHVIEHVADPLSLLKECRRILRSGGRMVVATPNATSLGHRLFGSSWFPLEPPRHLYVFSVPALCELARRAGFQGLDARTTTRGVETVFVGSRAIQETGHCDLHAIETAGAGRWLPSRERMEEWLRGWWDAAAGEEIALVARK